MDDEIELQRELEAAAPELWDKMILRAQWNAKFLRDRSPQERDDILQRVICANEVVWAMWRDPILPSGFKFEVIKGKRLWDAIDDDIRATLITAFLCSGPDEAQAWNRAFGDGSLH